MGMNGVKIALYNPTQEYEAMRSLIDSDRTNPSLLSNRHK